MSALFNRYRLPILSGIFIGTSYIPFPPWALLVLFIPLWHWWSKQNSWRQVWWGGWITQWTLTLIGFNWVAHTVHEFGHLPWPVAILTLFLFCGFANLQVPLAGVIWWWTTRRLKLEPRRALWWLPAAHILTELTYPMIFDWHFGYTLMYLNWPIAQTAEWIGFRGLSALFIALNGVVFWAWSNRHNRGAIIRAAALIALTLVSLSLSGAWLKNRLPKPDAAAKVLLVQANIGNLEKQEVEKGEQFRDSILDRYLRLTEAGAASNRPDLVVWPETAFPHLLNEPYFSTESWARRLRVFLMERNLALATGGYGYREDQRLLYNSLYVIGPNGEQTDAPYSKTRLLAFGEYLPGSQWFPKLREWLPQVGTFGRGQGPRPQQLGNFKLGPLICYEGIFDDFPRHLANQGAHLLVNVTNDSWYGKWQQPWQHLYMTLARAIEVRRPILRSTNTGISTVALADGKVLEQSPLHEEWTGQYDVPFYSAGITTVFMQGGYLFPWLLMFALVAWSLLLRKP